MLPRRFRKLRAGFGMVEAMISLVICATLLTAVGSAFVAAGQAIEQNDDFYRATQAGRVTLNRILTQVRKGTVNTASTSSVLRLITDTGTDFSYSYSSSAGTITLINNSTSATYALANNLTACRFDITTGLNYAGLSSVTKVAVTLTVSINGNQILLSGSCTPRRNFSL